MHTVVSDDHDHGIQRNQLKTANELTFYNLWKAAEQRIAHLKVMISLMQGRLEQAGYKNDPSYSTDGAEFDSNAREKRVLTRKRNTY